MSNNDSELTIEELIARVGDFNYRHDQPLWTRYAQMATAKMQLENIGLTKLSQEISKRQLDVSNEANALTNKLLLSNEQASIDSKTNAELMNKATQQLAKSTKLLNLATWVLVGFTAVQALIAFASLIKK